MRLQTYLIALAVTILVEVLVAMLILPRRQWRSRLGDVVLINLFTHPLATLAHHWLRVPWLLDESLVFVTEAALYWKVSRLAPGRAVILSFAANLATAALSPLF